MPGLNVGPDQLMKLALIARMHYVEGKTKVDIAEELGISRFKVSRLLDEAVQSGVVQIEINAPEAIDVELSLRLQDRYGLNRAVVIRVDSDAPKDVQTGLGLATGQLLNEICTPSDVLGLTAGRTLSAMAQSLTSLPSCDVVQLAGIAGPIQATGIEVIRRVSMAAGVRPWAIYAPLVTSDAETAAAIRRQPEIKQTFDQFKKVTVAAVAIGSWNPPDSQLHDNKAIPSRIRKELFRLGVQADIGSLLIDSSGETIDLIQSYCLAIDSRSLRRIPHVIGVAGGTRKKEAVRAALASGMIDSLITDASVAHYLVGDRT